MPQIIEDIFSTNEPQQINYAQGLQMPQPLKTSMHTNVPYTASQNTITNFNYYSGGSDVASSMAYQKNAIRGKIADQHVYNWSVPIPQKQAQQAPVQEAPVEFYSDPKQLLRKAISDIYRNCLMTKTHTFNQWSVFKCPVEGLTGGIFKYIVAIVYNFDHVPLGGKTHLASIPWVSFQTRQTETPAVEFGEVRPQATFYNAPNDSKSPVFDIINMKLDEATKFLYLADTLPVKVELLKLKETDVAAPRATIMSALEAFKTVVTFLD